MDGEMPEDLRSAVNFHGHLCPGLLMGYRAVRAAVDRGVVKRAEDEEVVAQVENDSCSADAVQALAGCTFGKGNLIFKDHGKQAFTFWNRTQGSGIRVALKVTPSKLLPEAEGAGEPQEVRRKICERLLEVSEEDLFHIGPAVVGPPPPARVFTSVSCQACGEPVMETRARLFQGEILCIPCLERREGI